MKKFNILLLSLVVYSSLSIATEQQKQTVNTANKNIVIATNVEDAEIKVDMASKSSDSNIKNIQEDFDIGTKNGVNKNIKVINVLDVIGDENVSPELRKRVTTTLNKAQYEFDKYESYINNHTKSTDNKFIDVEKELNNLKTFTEELEANFDLAKWMVISLSVGIVCLATIITMMWKGVVNVNRNDVEVLYSIERIKKDLRSLEKRVEMLEIAYKNEKR